MDGYPSNEDLYSPELDFMDTCMARLLTETDLGSRAWIRIGGRLVRGSNPHSQLERISDYRDINPQTGSEDRRAPGPTAQIPGSTPHDSTAPPTPPPPFGPTVQQDYTIPPPPPPPVQSALQAGAFVLHGWDGYDDLPVAALLVEFRMPDIERYTGIGCPHIHLHLYSAVMRGHRLDKAQMIMLFPVSLSGAAQRPTYLHLPPQPIYATQAPQRSPVQYHQQYRASPPPRAARQFTQLGMPLSRAFERLVERGLIAPLPPRAPPHLTLPGFRTNLHCAYHQRAGHDTDSRAMLRHAIQDLIDQGLVDLGRLVVTTDPLPAHDTKVIPPPLGGIHLIEFSGDEIFMMGWDGEAPQPINLYRASPPPRAARQFTQLGMPLSRAFERLVERGLIAPLPPRAPPHLTLLGFRTNLHYQGLVDLGRLVVTTDPLPAHDTKVIPPPLRALGGIHLIEFSGDEIFMMGWDGEAPQPINLYTDSNFSGYIHGQQTPRPFRLIPDEIPGQTSFPPIVTRGRRIAQPPLVDGPFAGRRVSYVLLDNSSALNVCPLVTAIALGFSPFDFGSSTQTVRAYNGTQRTVMVVSLEDDSRDMVPMLFDQYSSTMIPSMMRDMSYMPGLGLGRLQQGPREFVFTIDHDVPYGLGYTLSEEDAQHMARLRRDRVRARLSGVPFDYPLRPYTLQLTDYFVRGSEHAPRTEGTDHVFETVELRPRRQAGLVCSLCAFLRRLLTMICYGFGGCPHELHFAFDMFGVSAIDSDDVTLYDAYTDVMDMIGNGRILDVTSPGPRSAFDAFGISMLEFDDDGFVTSNVTHDVSVVEGAFDSVDPPLSFDIMSGFVTRFYDVSNGNNDMSIFKYLPVSQHFPLIAPPIPTTHTYDVDDVGDADGPLSGQSDSNSDSDMDGKKVKEEIQKQLGVGFLLVVEYPKWLTNVVPFPKKDSKVRVCVDFRDLNKVSPKDDFSLPHIDMLVDSTVGHSMLSFMDGFSGYNQILMALEDMEKTSFITEWGTYCYRVMPFGLKNAGATYQRAATALFHDMMHRDVEVYVDDMTLKSRDRADHLAALQRFFERIQQFRLRLNPKKCIFGVTFGKLLGHIVSERGIEVDHEKIRAILDMPAPKNERKIRGFLGRLQYISRFIARLTDIFLVLPTPGRPLLLYLSISDMALGCMLAQLDDSGKERVIYYLKFDIRYVTQKSVKGSIVADHLASLPVFDERLVDNDFPNEQFVSVASIAGWQLYFDGATNQSGFGIGILLISPQGDHIPRSVRLTFSDHRQLTNNIVEYEACIIGLEIALDLGVRQFDELRYIHLPRAENQFVDALATLAYVIEIPVGVSMRPLLVETRSALAYCCLIGDIEDQDELPWDALYRRSPDGLLLLCLDRASVDRVMREVHAGVCGPHMRGHMLALWGIDIIGKISPKSSSSHEYILVAIDYFTKWVEAASYARLTMARVAKFIRSHIICRYGVLHELISDRGVHIRSEVDTLIQEYGIQHHRSSAYRS
ncbi:Transposon Ty3-G Gag-Pol polyprotein [Vitis vinifera]|uniref:Transposon Ty3-G Gag-Pol polyprotein n=1 Tax=Vitis vinifera TaxID=29760 RepID=A0A438I7C2_VITVI|nr:Transposon Ty3-G Gag-Pol polyprotein [Vitis vinifera]